MERLVAPTAGSAARPLVGSGAAAVHDLKAMPTTTSLPAAFSFPGAEAGLGVEGDNGGRP